MWPVKRTAAGWHGSNGLFKAFANLLFAKDRYKSTTIAQFSTYLLKSNRVYEGFSVECLFRFEKQSQSGLSGRSRRRSLKRHHKLSIENYQFPALPGWGHVCLANGIPSQAASMTARRSFLSSSSGLYDIVTSFRAYSATSPSRSLGTIGRP